MKKHERRSRSLCRRHWGTSSKITTAFLGSFREASDCRVNNIQGSVLEYCTLRFLSHFLLFCKLQPFLHWRLSKRRFAGEKQNPKSRRKDLSEMEKRYHAHITFTSRNFCQSFVDNLFISGLFFVTAALNTAQPPAVISTRGVKTRRNRRQAA